MRRFVSFFTEHIAGVSSVIAALCYGVIILQYLLIKLSLQEFALTVTTTVVAVAIGALSIYVVRGAKHLRVTPRIFLSYTSDNKDMAMDVAEALRSAGALVWVDQEQLKPGEEIFPAVEKAIKEANSVVVLRSRESTPALNFELQVAQANSVPVVTGVSGDVQASSDLSKGRYVIIRAGEPNSLDELVRVAMHPTQ